MMDAVMYWLAGYWFNQGSSELGNFALDKVFPDHQFSSDWGDAFNKWRGGMAVSGGRKEVPTDGCRPEDDYRICRQ